MTYLLTLDWTHFRPLINLLGFVSTTFQQEVKTQLLKVSDSKFTILLKLIVECVAKYDGWVNMN